MRITQQLEDKMNKVLSHEGKVDIKRLDTINEDIISGKQDAQDIERERLRNIIIKTRDTLESDLMNLNVLMDELEEINVDFQRINLDVDKALSLKELDEFIYSISNCGDNRGNIVGGMANLNIDINNVPYKTQISYRRNNDIYKNIEIMHLEKEEDFNKMEWEM